MCVCVCVCACVYKEYIVQNTYRIYAVYVNIFMIHLN